MVKFLINLLMAFFILSSLSWGKDEEAKMQAQLQKEYGYDLTKAPFFLRFAYQKEFNKDWSKTDYPERYAFLSDYEINFAKQQAKDKAEAKLAADEERAWLLAKIAEERREKDRLKAQQAEDKAEEQDDKDRQKAFDQVIIEQQKQLRDMEQEATQKF